MRMDSRTDVMAELIRGLDPKLIDERKTARYMMYKTTQGTFKCFLTDEMNIYIVVHT